MAKRPALPLSARLRAQVAAALVERIEQLGMTQKDTAALLGIAQPQVSNLKNGRTAGFSLDRLIDLAGRAGLSVRLTLARPYRT